VDGERGLAHAAHAAHDHDRGLVGQPTPLQLRIQGAQGVCPVPEAGDSGRQLMRHRQRSCGRLTDREPVYDSGLYDGVRSAREVGLVLQVPGIGDTACGCVRVPCVADWPHGCRFGGR
jgi:hypothetical protein